MSVITLGDFQRPCVITNMTLDLYINKKERDNFLIILVKDHKTGSNYPAVVVIEKKYLSLFDYYC